MHRAARGFAAALLLLPLLPATARAQPGSTALVCPAFIDVTPQAVVRAAPPGWRVTAQPERHWLRGAELYEGDPAARMQLRPEHDRTTRVTTWTIGPGNQAPHLLCRYEGTGVALTILLPDGMRRCAAATRREPSRQQGPAPLRPADPATPGQLAPGGQMVPGGGGLFTPGALPPGQTPAGGPPATNPSGVVTEVSCR